MMQGWHADLQVVGVVSGSGLTPSTPHSSRLAGSGPAQPRVAPRTIVFRSGLLAEHGSGSIAVLTTVSFVPVLIGCSIGSGAQGEGLSQGRW